MARSEPETLLLEFKTTSSEDLGTHASRRQLSEVIAGFANADGGLVIWGIGARRGEDGIDCARELKPLTNPALFASRARSLHPDATSPSVEGVEHRAIERHDGTGFVVTRVPASDSGPHMAKFGEDRYMRRSGDRIIRMEHYEVADMFGRRRRPVIQFTYALSYSTRHLAARDLWEWEFSIVLALCNSGRGPARAPYLALRVAGGHIDPFGLNGNGQAGLPRVASAGLPGWTAFGGSMDTAIHPRTQHDVTSIIVRRPIKVSSLSDVAIEFRATADGIELQHGNVVISSAELKEALPASELQGPEG